MPQTRRAFFSSIIFRLISERSTFGGVSSTCRDSLQSYIADRLVPLHSSSVCRYKQPYIQNCHRAPYFFKTATVPLSVISFVDRPAANHPSLSPPSRFCPSLSSVLSISFVLVSGEGRSSATANTARASSPPPFLPVRTVCLVVAEAIALPFHCLRILLRTSPLVSEEGISPGAFLHLNTSTANEPPTLARHTHSSSLARLETPTSSSCC